MTERYRPYDVDVHKLYAVVKRGLNEVLENLFEFLIFEVFVAGVKLWLINRQHTKSNLYLVECPYPTSFHTASVIFFARVKLSFST